MSSELPDGGGGVRTKRGSTSRSVRSVDVDALHSSDVPQSTWLVISRVDDPGDVSTLCCLAGVMRKSTDPVGSLSLLRPIAVVRESSSP